MQTKHKNILMLGGTGFFGIHAVNRLLEQGHHITIATRGKASDPFEGRCRRIKLDRTNADSVSHALYGLEEFDVVLDNQAYCSNDIKNLLDVVRTRRFIFTSTLSVYDEDLQMDMKESCFDPLSPGLVWCDRNEFPYSENKRQAERALFQAYSYIPSVALRLTCVIGPDNYTERLLFYVENTVKGVPMHIDNVDEQLSFITSEASGAFLAWAALHDFTGPINGANIGTVTLKEILKYVEDKTDIQPIFSPTGEPGPFNGVPSISQNMDLAKGLGFEFASLQPELHKILDHYIERYSKQN